MAMTLDDLAAKVAKKTAPDSTVSDSPTLTRTDRGIQGTLIDDYAVEILVKILALGAILIFGSWGYLALERAIGVKVLTMIRIWSPVVAWSLMAFFKKPFLRGGSWFILATLTMIPALSGYLFQLMNGTVGPR